MKLKWPHTGSDPLHSVRPKAWCQDRWTPEKPAVDSTKVTLLGQLANLKVPSDRLRVAETGLRTSCMALSVCDEYS